jgi:hypothetical protein
MPAITNPIGKGFDLYFNSTRMVQVMGSNQIYRDNVVEMLVNLTVGALNLSAI